VVIDAPVADREPHKYSHPPERIPALLVGRVGYSTGRDARREVEACHWKPSVSAAIISLSFLLP